MNTDEFFESHLKELALRASYRGDKVFTHFLDLNQAQIARAAAGARGVSITFFGGYDEAERRMACFWREEAPVDSDFPLQCVQASWRSQFGSPAHRDLLGALMGLGFEREKIGDIALTDDTAYIFAECDMAAYIAQNLTSAGRVTLTCQLTNALPHMPPPQGRRFRDTVPSLRLDAVLAAGFSLSRSEAARAITQGKVFVDQAPVLRTDYTVSEGALVSCRGTGRFRLERVDGETRKGRIAVHIFLYGEGKK